MDETMMTFGSLFSGIGGMDLGLERAGMKCVWQVENNEYATRILEKHWPDVRRHGDVRTFRPDPGHQCDLIAGGFPCQDLSNAGTRIGIDGERSGLWKEFARIVGVLRPRYVLVENVPEITLPGRLNRVLGDLAALGFDAEWACLPAASFGAPHIRERFFAVAYAQEGDGRRIKRRDASERQTEKRHQRSRDPAHANGVHAQSRVFGPGREIAALPYPCWGTDQPGVDRASYGISHRVDRLEGLGNAVVPQVAEWIGRRILESANQL